MKGLIGSLATVLFLLGCGGSESGSSDGGSSSGSALTCSGGSSAGSYRCSGSLSYEVCQSGTWVYAGACTCTVSVGDPRKPPYYTNCKYHSSSSGTGASGIECSYAGVSCVVCTPENPC